MRQRLLAAILLLISVLMAGALPVQAMEVIRSFHADIDVARSGKLAITETIRVLVEGVKFKHGIYRDLPLSIEGNGGATETIHYRLAGVERDGATEPFHSESTDNQLRIYIGKPDVVLASGEHIFKITYEAVGAVHPGTYDQLTWDVTGAWNFRIEAASASIRLPDSGQARATANTSGQGGIPGDVRIARRSHAFQFTAVAPLEPGEQLTIGIELPHHPISRPNQSSRL